MRDLVSCATTGGERRQTPAGFGCVALETVEGGCVDTLVLVDGGWGSTF